jgi:transcriptional regulator with XRE-family HTH domain
MSPKIIQDYSKGVTDRFLSAIDKIVSDRSNGKVTQQRLGEALGINSSNINRLRTDRDRRVSVEACCRLCALYNISAYWLLMGQGEMFANDEFTAASGALKRKIAELERTTSDVQKLVATIKRGKS